MKGKYDHVKPGNRIPEGRKLSVTSDGQITARIETDWFLRDRLALSGRLTKRPGIMDKWSRKDHDVNNDRLLRFKMIADGRITPAKGMY